MWGNPEFECFLFEPDPERFNELKKVTEGHSNTHIFNVAFYSRAEEIDMFFRGENSFVYGVNSPILQSDNDNLFIDKRTKVLAHSFKEFDRGDIDFLFLDMEGSEWFVLQNLVSLPKVIIVELVAGEYINPFVFEIKKWLKEKGYIYKFTDDTDHTYALKSIPWIDIKTEKISDGQTKT